MKTALKALSAAALLALPLAACGEPPASAPQDSGAPQSEAPAQAETRQGDSPMVVTEREAGGVRSQGGANLNLPEGFPEDIAIHEDLNIYGANAIPGMGFSLAATSSASQSDLAQFYQREMPTLGWTEMHLGDATGTVQMLRFEKDGRSVSVNFVPNNNGTAVAIAAMNAQ